MKHHLLKWLALSLCMMQVSHAQNASTAKPALLVFAAASLTNVLDELSQSYQATQQQVIKTSFAASSALAKQIEAGANADLFMAADTDWMDYLQSRNLIQTETRRNLLANQLVLIAPSNSPVMLKISTGFALQNALGTGRLAIGDPESVPAGKYARSALTTLKVWDRVSQQLVFGDSVRTTLNFVATGNAPLGIVYATDAAIESKVRIVDTFPDNTHPAIVYPVALTRSAQPSAREFLNYLRSSAAQSVLRKYGFTVLP